MNKINTFLFDIDGTLLDTKKFIIDATKYALSKHGFKVPNDKDIARLVGLPFDSFYYELVRTKENKHLRDSHRDFQLANLHLSKIYPNTLKVLNKLKENDFKMAVITSRHKMTARQTLEDAGIADFFEVIITGDDLPYLKPNPAPLLLALEKLGEKSENAVMVGDSNLDIEAGRNAGTKTVRVTFGFHTDKLDDPKPDFIIDDIKDLLKLNW